MSLNLVDFRISKGTDGLQSLQNPPIEFLKNIKAVSLCCSLGTNPYAFPIMLGVKLTFLLKTVEPNKDPRLTRKPLLLSEEMSWGRTESLLKGLLWIVKINEHPRTKSSTPFSCSQHSGLESFPSGYKYNSPCSKKNVNSAPRQHLT